MAKYCSIVLTATILLAAVSAFAGVNLTSPASGATVSSPVTFVATATSNCQWGVASMGIYTAPYNLAYTVSGANLNTQLNLGAGTYNATVVAWDYCGGATTAPVTFTVSNQTGVNVSSPANNSTVSSSVHFVASATAACGVASMGIYTAPYNLAYVSNGSTLDATLNLAPGTYNAVVQEWDRCGGAIAKPVTFTVSGSAGNSFTNLQNNTGWQGWGELPPVYDICAYPCPGVAWGVDHYISSPSLSGSSARFSLGGTTPYSDALWNNHLIGDGSTQGMLDSAHQLVPKYSSFTYDLYFYTSSLGAAESMEFDVGQFFNNQGFLFGTECRIKGGVWAVWNNVANRWDATSIPCNPVNGSWNHVVINVQRTWDNMLWYKSITLNGNTYQLNWYYPPSYSPGWYGLVVNLQLDGDYKQTPYSVYFDKVTLTYN